MAESGNKIIASKFKQGKWVRSNRVDVDDLRYFGHKCNATFAGDKGELIVLLY